VPKRYDPAMSDEFYTALSTRDTRYEGAFFYGVKTTGVYCRPTCKSRRPLRKNVEFYESQAQARAAGYRSCKRCKPDATPATLDERFLQVCRAIESAEETPTLRELAELVKMSETHLQRSFKAAVGISPREYATMVRDERLRSGLRSGASVTAAIYEAGFGSSSQAYGEQRLGMTLSEFRSGGKTASITFAIVESALGKVLVAATARGVCRVDVDDSTRALERRLHEEFPQAEIVREDDRLASTTSLIVDYLAGTKGWPQLPVDIRATAFQSRVWEALRALRPGTTTTYSELARALGDPKAARAVARACASNPVALLIPCHRVLAKSGELAGYRWGVERKRQLLELEREQV
jgi:AraC family transcriptional regulator of adaptative response/methylated-DNA-[protein]-cysteine methyltransferase